MSDRIMQSSNESEQKVRRSTQSYQSVWMAHWKQTSYNTAAEPQDHMSNHFGIEGFGRDSVHHRSTTGLEIAANICRSANQSLRMSGTNIRNERLGCKYFALDSPHTNGGSSSESPVGGANHMKYLRPQISHNFPGSTSHIVPYRFDQEKHGCENGQKVASSFSDRSILVSNKLLPNANLRIREQPHCNNHIRSGFFLPERKTDSQSDSEKITSAYLRENNTALLLDAPSTSDNHFSAIGKDLSLNHLRITKTNDDNMSKEREFLENSELLTGSNRNMISDLSSVYPFACQGQRGLKLQFLGSFIDLEEKGDLEDLNVSKVVTNHDYSAETDTMEMDSFKEKNELAGLNSVRSNKVINTKLPDINLELPALAAAASSSDDVGPGSSRTQSLDMDNLLAHSEQPSTANNIICSSDPLEKDPTTRWVKRLKMSASDPSSHGTKNSDLGKSLSLSHEKVKNFFGGSLPDGISSSDAVVRKRHDKLLTLFEKTEELQRKHNAPLMDLSQEDKRILLSDSWIQRWLHKGSASPQKCHKTVVECEPRSSKLTLEDLQKKQFPSIAAMALMGKAMNGFEPCDIQRRGASVIWNTRAF